MWCCRVGLLTAFVAIAHLASAARVPGNASTKAPVNGTAHASPNATGVHSKGTAHASPTATGATSLARSTVHTSSETAINHTAKPPPAPKAPNAVQKVKANATVAKEATNASKLNAVHTNASKLNAVAHTPLSGVLPHFLAKQGLEAEGGACACHFEDQCSCTSTMEFMDCIATACASGKCDCKEYQFHHACLSISSTCPDLELECSIGQAQCLYERESRYQGPQVEQKDKHTAADIHDLLRDLKERKCRLQLQVEDGWLNSDKHLEAVTTDINKLMDELAAMHEKRPEMHCEKHFEEWHYPETHTPAPPAQNAGVVAAPGLAVTLLAVFATM